MALRIICRGDKKHMAQIKRHIDKVIIEGGVLLGVKGFQQGSAGSPRKSPASLSISSSSIRGLELLAEIMALMILPGMAPI